MENRIENILSYKIQEIAKSKALFDELKSLTKSFGIKVSWGCSSCVPRAYNSLLNAYKKQNPSFKSVYEKLALNDKNMINYKLNVSSYRFQKTGKVLTNENSTEEERKEVYNSSEGRKSLFDPFSIPQEKTIQKPVTKKAPVKKKPAPKKES